MVRDRLETDEFGQLRKLGFKLPPAVDELSEQPASGGLIGGRRGEQECGIKGGAAQEDSHDRDLNSNVEINSSDIEADGTRFPQEVIDKSFPGVSQYSSAHISAEDGLAADRDGGMIESEASDAEGGRVSQSELETLLRERLLSHPELCKEDIQISFSAGSGWKLTGHVHSEAARMDAREISEAVLGHSNIDNRLEVLPR